MNEDRLCGCGERGGVHKNECAVGLDMYDLRKQRDLYFKEWNIELRKRHDSEAEVRALKKWIRSSHESSYLRQVWRGHHDG